MQSIHRVATAAFWRTFHHDGKIHRAWQWPISGVHSIMMEKFSQAGEGGGCTPTPFHYIYHHVQSCSCSVLSSCCEGRYALSISSLPLCTLSVGASSNESETKACMVLFTYSLQDIVSCSGGKLYNSKEKAISLFGEFQVNKEEVHDAYARV